MEIEPAQVRGCLDHTPVLTAAVILEAMGKGDDVVAELEACAKTSAGQRSIPVLLALARARRRARTATPRTKARRTT